MGISVGCESPVGNEDVKEMFPANVHEDTYGGENLSRAQGCETIPGEEFPVAS